MKLANAAAAQRRAGWLKMLHRWHWISAALSLIGLIGFAITGITLNHASQIGGSPQTLNEHAELPPSLVEELRQLAGSESPPLALPPRTRAFLREAFGLSVGQRVPEWSADEVYLSLPRPGGDGWLAIDLLAGSAELERTDRGWIAYFNDLHKGRNTGSAWNWFIDLFAVACLLFAVTGLCLLQLHARQRGATWPLVSAGLLLPLLLLLLIAH